MTGVARDIPEAAMQELRMRQGQVQLREADYKRDKEDWKLASWSEAEARLQGAMGVLVALYGTDQAVEAWSATQ